MTTLELLKAARARIERPEAWTRGEWAKTASGMAPCERDWELPEYAMAWSRLAPDPEKDDIERRYKRRLNDLVTSLSETRT